MATIKCYLKYILTFNIQTLEKVSHYNLWGEEIFKKHNYWRKWIYGKKLNKVLKISFNYNKILKCIWKKQQLKSQNNIFTHSLAIFPGFEEIYKLNRKKNVFFF